MRTYRPNTAVQRHRRKDLSILIVAPYEHETAGGQAKSATYLVDHLRDRFRVANIVIPPRVRRRWPARLCTTVLLLCRFAFLLIRHRVDVVHVFTPCHRAGLYEKLAFTTVARGLRRKTILNFRNAFDLWYQRWGPREQRLVARLIRRNCVVLCQYHALGHFLIEQGIAEPDQVRVLANGLCLREVPRHRQQRVPGTPTRILLLGLIGYRKGVDRLIQAAAILRQRTRHPYSVEIVGPPASACELERLTQLVRHLGAECYVHLRGPVSGDDKAALLAETDVFVLPSRAEGFPNSLLEAMGACLPVVVSDRGAMPEIVQAGAGGFVVDPEDPDELARALETLIANPLLRRRMGAWNRRQVERHYELRHMLQRFQALYEEVGGRVPRRTAA